MAVRPVPIFATERTAAQLLDMSLEEFRALVKAGHLPPPRTIGDGASRWFVEDLSSIAKGDAIHGDRSIKW